jgi:hypothetical protein
MPQSGKESLIGLDLNATRVRAAAGVAESAPEAVLLEGAQEELPLALSLEGRHVEVGSAGVALCRRLPHLGCVDFLGHLGEERQWTAGRHRLDAARALSLVLDHLKATLASHDGFALAYPAYLTPSQLDIVTAVAAKARLPLLGLVASPLAAALTAYAEQPWSGPALVADVDEHALSWAVVFVEDEQVRLLTSESWPLLGMRYWRERLLDVLADRCVRQSRRDPRDSGDAEQSLYEQIEPVLDVCCQGQMAEVAVQTTQWYQNLIVQPGELAAGCAALVRQSVEAMQALQTATLHHGGAGAVLLSAATARLPGLKEAIEAVIGAASTSQPGSSEDFGDSLLEATGIEHASLYLLAPDAAARAAHALAVRWRRGELPPGRLDAAPLLPPPPAESGVPRLHFNGQEFPLALTVFTLGRHPECDLTFDSDLYPAVSGRHCEIVRDRLGYLLRDHSRHGTLVNERPVNKQTALHPGDWIRLGPGGPVLRFLGQTPDQRRLMTTA